MALYEAVQMYLGGVKKSKIDPCYPIVANWKVLLEVMAHAIFVRLIQLAISSPGTATEKMDNFSCR